MSLLDDNIIDVRDLIQRFEELQDERWDLEKELEDAQQSVEISDPDDGQETPEAQDRLRNAVAELDSWLEDYWGELDCLADVLDDLRGAGGDHQWQGAWYPLTLIADTYFVRFAEELAGDMGAVDPNGEWPLNCIDWERAANELQVDYTSVEIDGQTYWYR